VDRQELTQIKTQIQCLEAEGNSVVVAEVNDRLWGAIALADQTRPSAEPTVRRLWQLGIRHLVMLTGDNATVAQRVAAQVGVADVRAHLLPSDKLAMIRHLAQQHGAVAMLGDGVNDAPALATATVGIAMGGAGTAIALESADVALMNDDLHQLPFAIALSRASRAIIQQNLAVALGVTAILIATSLFGVVQLGGAVILHEGSTIIVVLNALRLLAFPFK
jgi:Cd2+/Zn2+-exporting ATPase